MKTLFSVLIFMVVTLTVQAQSCCNVVDRYGNSVKTTDGVCVKAPRSSTGDCDGSSSDSDQDGDGVADIEDDCIDVAGDPKNNGCPEISSENKKLLKDAIEGVKFETNSDVLLEESYAKLDLIAALMKKNPIFKLKLSGYTDNTGADDYNLDLSKRRAESVKKYLIKQGVSKKKLMAEGYGNSNPVADNATPEGRAKNRRVDFKIVFKF